MKNIFIAFLVSVILISFSCSNNSGNEVNESDTLLTLDELYEKPGNYTDQNIKIKGLVTHICRHGGQKLFITGSEEGSYLRVNTNEKITEFPMDLEGRIVTFTGMLVKMDIKTTIAVTMEEKEHHGEDKCEAEQMSEGTASYFLLAEKYDIIK